MKKNIYNPPFLRLIVFVTIGYLFYYLWWRTTQTLNPDALIFSLLLLSAEGFGVLNYLFFSWMTMDVSPMTPHKSPKRGIKVDVFVPTYDESPEILEATLVGCNLISYPHTTYVLDDGDRAEVKVLAERLGCEYLTRPSNEHAKAGNINHAMKKTEGEFIVILDADMVPQPDFLERTLGYFEDEKLAIVQLPQEFYNMDSIQHEKKKANWHEQVLFYHVIQPGKNRSNSAFWCGSPSLARREALEDVGGVATETITEDIHTSVRLHSRGWSIRFVNEVLAYGIAPQTIKAFLLQRLRWAQGTMQLYRGADSPLWKPNLSLKQRVSYLASFLAYFEAFQKLFLILTPTFIIMFNIFPMRVSSFQFFLRWIPYFLFSTLANKVSGRGYFYYFQTQKFNLLKMVTFLQASLSLVWKKPLKFAVTPKSVDKSTYSQERKQLRIYMVITGIITGVVLYGMLQLFTDPNPSLRAGHFVIAILWAAFNGVTIYLGIKEVLRKRHERKHYRFPVNFSGEIIDRKNRQVSYPVQIIDLSVSGGGIAIDKQVELDGRNLLLHFDTADRKCLTIPIGEVYRRSEVHNGYRKVGLAFSSMLPVYRKRLFELLFVSLPRSVNIEPQGMFAISLPKIEAETTVSEFDACELKANEIRQKSTALVAMPEGKTKKVRQKNMALMAMPKQKTQKIII